MCCICFSRFALDELHIDVDGSKVDVCIPCEELNERYRAEHPERYGRCDD